MLARRSLERLAFGILLALGGLPGLLRASPPPVTNDFCPVTPGEWAVPEVSTEYLDQTVYFCCKRCRKQFLENPEHYLGNLPQFAGSPTTRETSTPVPEPEPGFLARAYRFAGKVHPMAVHFPIALVLVVFLLELGFLMTRHTFLKDSARLLLPLAALSALGAALLGWAAGAHAHYPGPLATVLTQHRWAGIATATATTLAALSSGIERRRSTGAWALGTRVLLVLAATLVVVTGHLGGTLIYGPAHLQW